MSADIAVISPNPLRVQSPIERVFRGPPDLHYVEFPSSQPTLLLLHGAARDGRDWQPLLPELLDEWHVVILDFRGHGESGRASGAYLVSDYARDAVAFVRGTFSAPITVMGHSLGAMVALNLAAECAPLVERVVLEDPPFHTMGDRIGSTPYRAQFAGMREVALRGGNIAELTDTLADIRIPTLQGMKRFGDIRDHASLQSSAEFLMRVDPELFVPLAAGRWLDGFDHAALWHRVVCPTLLLQGDPTAGGAFADEDVEAARRGLRVYRHRQFPGVGHQIHRTVPAEVASALREFSQTQFAETTPAPASGTVREVGG